MVDIHHEGFAEAPLSTAFAYINDFRTAPTWMFGLAKFEPVGEVDHGLGATFDATFQVRPVKLSSTVEITEWVQDSLIAFTSIKGFKNWSTWRFTAAGPTRTKIVVVFSYALPGGLAGKALGKAMEPVVALSVKHSDATLRKNIEVAHAAGT